MNSENCFSFTWFIKKKKTENVLWFEYDILNVAISIIIRFGKWNINYYMWRCSRGGCWTFNIGVCNTGNIIELDPHHNCCAMHFFLVLRCVTYVVHSEIFCCIGSIFPPTFDAKLSIEFWYYYILIAFTTGISGRSIIACMHTNSCWLSDMG